MANCNKLLYAANTSGATVASGGTVPFGTTIRNCGQCIEVSGNGINIREVGWFEINISATLLAAATGNVTLSLYKDGVAIPGATAAVTATASDSVNLNIPCVVRNACCNTGSALTLVVTGGQVTVSNVATVVKKVA